MPVVFIPYKDIDKLKWDACICSAANRLIYARPFYLDIMSENWDALVLNDYEAVMPLTWKKKLRIKYLYQPAFIQQGGIFSKLVVSQKVMNYFLDVAFDHFRFAEITFNYANCIIPDDKKIKWSVRANYIIDLNNDYVSIFKSYDPGFIKSLKRVNKFSLEYIASPDYAGIIQLYKELYSSRLPYIKQKDYKNFEKICAILAMEDKVITRLAFNQEKELVAAVVLLADGNRLYNIVSCITNAGKKIEANYFLYDKLIAEFAGRYLNLDLEGSDVKGISAFYKKFNPVPQPYPFASYNQLHPIIKLFKR